MLFINWYIYKCSNIYPMFYLLSQLLVVVELLLYSFVNLMVLELDDWALYLEYLG